MCEHWGTAYSCNHAMIKRYKTAVALPNGTKTWCNSSCKMDKGNSTFRGRKYLCLDCEKRVLGSNTAGTSAGLGRKPAKVEKKFRDQDRNFLDTALNVQNLPFAAGKNPYVMERSSETLKAAGILVV